MTDHETKPEPRQPFGRIPTSLATSGALQTLKLREARLLLVIAAHINGRTDVARVGLETLALETGLGRRSIQRAISSLKGHGLLRVKRGGGPSKVPNAYQLVVLTDGGTGATIECACSGSASSDTRATQECASSPSPEPEHAPLRAGTGATTHSAQRTEIPTGSEQIGRPAARATAENMEGGKQKQPADCELWTALRDRGMGEPMCSRLANNPKLTLAMVETTQGREGALVENLKEAIVKQSQIDERDRKRTEAQAREDSERRRASLVVEAEAQAAETILSKFTDQQQAEVFGIMVSAPMPHQARTWLLCTVPPGMLARQLDPDGYEREYREILGLPDLPAKDRQSSMFPGKMLGD